MAVHDDARGNGRLNVVLAVIRVGVRTIRSELLIKRPIAARRAYAPAEASDGRGWMAGRTRLESMRLERPIKRTIGAARTSMGRAFDFAERCLGEDQMFFVWQV